jgi:hypothetical protein
MDDRSNKTLTEICHKECKKTIQYGRKSQMADIFLYANIIVKKYYRSNIKDSTEILKAFTQ